MFSLLLLHGGDKVHAQPSDALWRDVTRMDAGPQPDGKTGAITRERAAAHLVKQESLLRQMIQSYARDSRIPEAKVRLASVLTARGRAEGQAILFTEAEALRIEVEENPKLPLRDRSAAGFSRLTTSWVTAGPGEIELQRDRFLSDARRYADRYPGDTRYGRLLVELAVVYWDKPDVQAALLREAATLMKTDPAMKGRIEDDLIRLSMVGRPFPERYDIVSGPKRDLAAVSASAKLVLFWSPESAPSISLIDELASFLKSRPDLKFEVVLVQVGGRPAPTELTGGWDPLWTLMADPIGWESPAIRPLGINVLPNLWILDASGVVRHVNAQRGMIKALESVVSKTP